MKNYSKVTAMEYLEKMKNILDELGRTGGKCNGILCSMCGLYGKKTGCKINDIDHPEEMIKAVMEYEPHIDWEHVPVDTKVLVRNREDDCWVKRHFAKYENGKIYVFVGGSDSFTGSYGDIGTWKYTKLYK